MLHLSLGLFGQNDDYNIDNIPAICLENAQAVIRNNQTDFKVISDQYAVMTVKYAVTILNENGSLKEILTIGINITERKKAEDQLRLQSTALKSAANGIMISDPEGIIQWINPAFTELTFASGILGGTRKERTG